MHVVIINGSPRIKKNSNTGKIISAFTRGLGRIGATSEVFALSDRNVWDEARRAFLNNDKIIIAHPLFVECVPALLLEFLESLPEKREKPAELSFILQGGFDEGAQMRCGEAFLKTLPEQLGCTFGGTLVRGGNFFIRTLEDEKLNKTLLPFETMGESFGRNGNFLTVEAEKFAGIERYPFIVRMMLNLTFKTLLKRNFDKIAAQWGCTRPLDDKPYAD